MYGYRMRPDPKKVSRVESERCLMVPTWSSARTLFALMPILLVAPMITWGLAFIGVPVPGRAEGRSRGVGG